MARKKTLKIEVRASQSDASTYWVIVVSGKVAYGGKGQLPFYDLALAFAEGYTGQPLTERYRTTGKPIYSVCFDPLEALRSLNA